MDFVSDFQRLKDSSGKTVKEIAEACDLSESTITRYLSGKNAPPVDVAEGILKYLSESVPDEPERSDVPFRMVLILSELYKRQIAELRADHEKDARKAEVRFYVMLGLVVVLTAIIIYLVIDASHGGWGFFQHSADILRSGGGMIL
mgnify:FL=1